MVFTVSFFHLIIRYRYAFIFFFLICSVGGGIGLGKLELTVDPTDYLLKEDEAAASGNSYPVDFSPDLYLGVLIEAPDVFDPDVLVYMDQLESALEEGIPNAESALSIVSLPPFFTGGAGLEFQDSRLSTSSRDRLNFKSLVLDDPFLNGRFVSSDASEAWIVIPVAHTAAMSDMDIGRSAWAIMKDMGPEPDSSLQATITGLPVVNYRKQQELTGDLIRIMILAAAVAVLLSIYLLRCLPGVLGTLGVFVSAVVPVLGAQGWLGRSIDSGFAGVPILLAMGVSIGYAVHVHRFYKMKMAETGSRQESAAWAMALAAKPVIYTALTTVAALISFIFIEITPVRWVGISSALSVVFACGASLLLFPSLLSLGGDSGSGCRLQEPRFMRNLFAGISRIILNESTKVLLLFSLLFLIAVFFAARVTVDFDMMEMMGTRLPHMADLERLSETALSAGDPLVIELQLPSDSANEEDSFRNPGRLRDLAAVEERLSELHGVKRVTSVNTSLKEVNFLLHQRRPEFFIIPEEPTSVEALIRLTDVSMPEEVGKWIRPDGQGTRIVAELSTSSSRDIETLLFDIDRHIEASFSPGVDFTYHGSAFGVAIMNQRITRGLLVSLASALVSVTLVMILVFKSLRWGLVAMIPNVFPVLVAGGILGAAGIRLEFITVTVAPIILGLAVDDTIHFMTYLRDEITRSSDFQLSLERSLKSVGGAITETTIILGTTFLVFAASRINGLRYMGLIASAGMAAAYAADLLVVPILVNKLVNGFSVGRHRMRDTC